MPYSIRLAAYSAAQIPGFPNYSEMHRRLWRTKIRMVLEWSTERTLPPHRKQPHFSMPQPSMRWIWTTGRCLATAMQAGFAAENAIRAATLARQGLTGQVDVLEGTQGYFSLTGDPDSEKHARAFARLGKRLAIDAYGIVIKPYPSCGYTHRLIDCARQSQGNPHRCGLRKPVAGSHVRTI